ncbi:MAG: hypothetical protein AAB385_02915 [Planctomycetota bacterium]
MPARTTRQEARSRILAAFGAQLDRMIPEDESVPLRGAIRLRRTDFEDQAEVLAQTALPVVLEERAALASNAEVEAAGRSAFGGLWFRGSVSGERGDAAGGALALRSGGAHQAARAVPLVWRFFFPLRSVIGDCRRRFR